MAKLYFRYGTMGSGKSIDALKAAYSYECSGRKVVVFSPAVDTRSGVGKLRSRVGMEREAFAVRADTNLFSAVKGMSEARVACVIVDEAQFLAEEQVIQLAKVVDDLDIPVICYGLKNDFRNSLFVGSEALVRFADKIEELKSICRHCGGKATMNLRVIGGGPVYSGEQLHIGGDESYIPVCRKHWHNPPSAETANRSATPAVSQA